MKQFLAIILLMIGSLHAQTGSNGYPTKELSGVPNCPDSGGNHLNATSGTTFVCGTSSSGGAGGTAAQFSTTAVTATNPSAEAALMELSLPAAYLNTLNQPYVIHGSGTYNTASAQTPTITFKVKLCTVSGCGSGTVVTLVTIVTTATIAAVTNNSWNINLKAAPNVIGSSGTLVVHGPLAVDLGALTTTADSIFNDVNTAASSTIDLTAALFLDFTVLMSSSNASNQVVQQLGGISPDSTTVSVSSGTNGNISKYTSATTIGDGGFLASNVTRLDTTNTAAAAMTLDLSGATGATAFKVPVIAGATAGANGVIDYDSTNGNTHIRANGADAIAGAFASAPTTGDLVKATVVSSNVLLADAGSLATNAVRKDSTNTMAAASTIDASTNASVIKNGMVVTPSVPFAVDTVAETATNCSASQCYFKAHAASLGASTIGTIDGTHWGVQLYWQGDYVATATVPTFQAALFACDAANYTQPSGPSSTVCSSGQVALYTFAAVAPSASASNQTRFKVEITADPTTAGSFYVTPSDTGSALGGAAATTPSLVACGATCNTGGHTFVLYVGIKFGANTAGNSLTNLSLYAPYIQ